MLMPLPLLLMTMMLLLPLLLHYPGCLPDPRLQVSVA